MNQTHIHRCLESGLSVLVGTVDAHGQPACCRAVALTSTDDLETLTVFVPVSTSHEVIQNLGTTKRIAVGASFPLDHCTTQLKGTASEVRLARDDEQAFIQQRLSAFADVLDKVGVPRRLTRSVACWPAFAISVRVEEIFDQTPGPHAGSRIR